MYREEVSFTSQENTRPNELGARKYYLGSNMI